MEKIGIGISFEIFEDGIIDGFDVGIGCVLGVMFQNFYKDCMFIVVLLDVFGEIVVLIVEFDEYVIVMVDFGKIVCFLLSLQQVNVGDCFIVLVVFFVGVLNGIISIGGVFIVFLGYGFVGFILGVNGLDFGIDFVSLGVDFEILDKVIFLVVCLKFQILFGLNENLLKIDVMVVLNLFMNEILVNFNLKVDV